MKKITGVVAFLMVVYSLSAQTSINKAQAMFIYNFTRLIEWPANYKTGPFVIGVYGSTSTFDELESYCSNKAVGSQTISIKKFASISEIGVCHILFVPLNKAKELAEIQGNMNAKSTLIISEKSGAIESGAAINFLIIGDKLKFEIKPANATAKKINMSSKLNEMAYKVY